MTDTGNDPQSIRDFIWTIIIVIVGSVGSFGLSFCKSVDSTPDIEIEKTDTSKD